MLEDNLKTLEGVKDKLMVQLGELEIPPKTYHIARTEIEVHVSTIRNYIQYLYEKGYSLDGNFKMEEYKEGGLFEKTVEQRISNHLSRMKNVIEKVKKGRFKSEFGIV